MISKEVFSCGVGGIVVSIAAFQAVDPGSIPGRRNILFLSLQANIEHGSSDHSAFSHVRIVLFLFFFCYLFLLETVLFFLCEIKV